MGLTTHVVRGAVSERLLIMLHGYGSHERDLPEILSHLDPDGRFLAVFPRAPYAVQPGAFAWFHFGNPDVQAGTMRSSLEVVDELLDESCDQFGLDRSASVVGGFSQGGAMAIALGLRKSSKPHPAGVLSMSGFVPPDDQLEFGEPDVLPPVLMQHGTLDVMVPIDRATWSARVLSEMGAPLTFLTYPMEHQIVLESVRDAKAWLDRVCAGERPSQPLPPEEEVIEEGAVRSVSQAAFESEVLRSDKPVIVDFWAPWCQPCLQVSPIVEQIAAMRKGSYKVVKVNIDEAPKLAQEYQVQSIPMIAMFRNGRIVGRSLGVKARPQMEAELGMIVIP